jgi:serine/threonine protein kinase
MNPERWSQIESLYHAALERAPGERAAFLGQACEGDPALRAEVESLLAYDSHDSQTIGASPDAVAAEMVAETKSPSLIGTWLGHYRILSLLGVGGMGEVYLAEDDQLGRKVAIKFLPDAMLADAQAKHRLLREARAAAKLDHPNICTIHEVGEEAGRSFIVMQYIEGESLAARIAREPLKLQETLAFAVQIAEAFVEAHRHGIIHRDIKPQNLMVTSRGQVKILDFGLAKLTMDLAEASQQVEFPTQQSMSGAIAGTAPYMSPEQARGERLDVRSDIFSLGTTLYEMVSGRRPFEGKCAAVTLVSILTREPAPLELATAPVEFGRIVQQCLEKTPERRYQTMQELIVDLENVRRETAAARPDRRKILLAGAVLLSLLLAAALALNVGRLRSRLSGGADAEHETRLAVLPFENLTGDPEQEYLSDELTEEMIAQLGRLDPLRLAVIARASSMQYKKSGKTIEQIGSELRAEYILEGSARQEDGRVRINTRLIRAHDQTQVWADSYEGEQRNLLLLQAEAARAIARQFRIQINPQEQARLTRSSEADPEAYVSYLTGRFHLAKYNRADTKIALAYYNLALTKEPRFALAYAGIALVWIQQQMMGVFPAKDAGARATEAITRALALDNTNEVVQYASGVVNHYVQWDWAASEAAFHRALAINPNFTDAHSRYAHLLQRLRRPEEAMVHIERAIELDPHNSTLQASHCQNLSFIGRYDEGIAQCRKALEASATNLAALTGLHGAYFMKGMYFEAFGYWKAKYASMGHPEIVEALERGYTEGGYARAMVLAAEKSAVLSRTTFVAPFNIAALYGNAGKTEEALAWLEKAYIAHDPNMTGIHIVPAFTSLHSEPRFQELLRRMNLP